MQEKLTRPHAPRNAGAACTLTPVCRENSGFLLLILDQSMVALTRKQVRRNTSDMQTSDDPNLLHPHPQPVCEVAVTAPALGSCIPTASQPFLERRRYSLASLEYLALPGKLLTSLRQSQANSRRARPMTRLDARAPSSPISGRS